MLRQKRWRHKYAHGIRNYLNFTLRWRQHQRPRTYHLKNKDGGASGFVNAATDNDRQHFRFAVRLPVNAEQELPVRFVPIFESDVTLGSEMIRSSIIALHFSTAILSIDFEYYRRNRTARSRGEPTHLCPALAHLLLLPVPRRGRGGGRRRGDNQHHPLAYTWAYTKQLTVQSSTSDKNV